MSNRCCVLVENVEGYLLHYLQLQLSETVCECIFINLLKMAASEVTMNGKTGFPNFVAQTEDVHEE